MFWNDQITLVKENYDFDEIGNQIPSGETRNTIFCDVRSITRREFYDAAVAGLKPEIAFAIHNDEYQGEKKIEYQGITYKVIRTYTKDFEELELICGR